MLKFTTLDVTLRNVDESHLAMLAQHGVAMAGLPAASSSFNTLRWGCDEFDAS